MARKSAFVNDMILQSLNQKQQTVPPVIKVAAKLDDEITEILQKKNLEEYDKAKLYSNTLRKYLTTRENIDRPQTPPDTLNQLLSEAPSKIYSDDAIIETVPKRFAKQGQQLLRHIKDKLTWSDDGVVSFRNKPIEGSNIVDLVNDALRSRKSFQPTGWREFAGALQQMNVPSNLIGNPNRKGVLSTSLSPNVNKDTLVQWTTK